MHLQLLRSSTVTDLAVVLLTCLSTLQLVGCPSCLEQQLVAPLMQCSLHSVHVFMTNISAPGSPA